MQVNSGERMDVPGEEGSTVGVFPILTLKGSPFQLDFGCPPPVCIGSHLAFISVVFIGTFRESSG